jgi:hypothetical protein
MSWEPINPSKPNEDEVIGDEPFDIISEALDKVVSCYQTDWRRKPTTRELVKTFEQVLAPRFSATVLEGETTDLVRISFKTKRIPRRQKYRAGDFLRALAANGKAVYGRIFEVGRYGPMIGVYDSIGLESPSLESLRKLRLIVKVTPIHHELLEERSWLVIGNLPVTQKERQQPQGPLEISGSNEQLNAANYFYGLPHEKSYGLNKWVNR